MPASAPPPMQAMDASAMPQLPVPLGPLPDLPHGWLAAADRGCGGGIYFYCPSSGERSWQHPSAPLPAGWVEALDVVTGARCGCLRQPLSATAGAQGASVCTEAPLLLPLVAADTPCLPCLAQDFLLACMLLTPSVSCSDPSSTQLHAKHSYFCNSGIGASQWERPGAAAAPAPAAALDASVAAATGPSFVPAQAFSGPRPGYVFKQGGQGLGYYQDSTSSGAAASPAAPAAALLPPRRATDGPPGGGSGMPRKTRQEAVAAAQAARNAALAAGKGRAGGAKRAKDELDPMDPVGWPACPLRHSAV